MALPASETIDLIFAGQTGIGASAPQRFEATARVRVSDRHRLDLVGGGAQFFTITDKKSASRQKLGQLMVRAVDEWIAAGGGSQAEMSAVARVPLEGRGAASPTDGPD